MNKITYTPLLLATILLTGYTSYYTLTNQEALVSPTVTPATTTPSIVYEFSDKNSLKTKTGKTITVKETNPNGESLSTITITPKGFENNEPIILEKNKLTNFFLLDMNKDTFDELILITTAQGAGSYGEVTIFTTKGDLKLQQVVTPEVTEDSTKQGELFEGYAGYDGFSVLNGALVREFPTNTSTNTGTIPTGLARKIAYSIIEKEGAFLIELSKNLPTITQGTSTASSTPNPEGKTWAWVSSQEKGKETLSPKGARFVLSFVKDRHVTGTTDCNGFVSTYVLSSKNLITFRPFTTTKMSCKGSVEQAYLEQLLKTTSYTIGTSTLIFNLGKNDGTMTFQKR